ncbi:MAG: methyltransferase domain-containing protein [Deltaproteobacteria bacterium]|nr:methyltransferase domain-containing protein [Deltaproteobacteria bacterium]
MAWDAQTYLQFGDERTRAAAELLSRVPLNDPRHVVDLGCGPGNSTALLLARYPEAQVLGVDNAPGMLTAARATGLRAEWLQVDLQTWLPPRAYDLVYANATFQWLDDHPGLFPRWMAHLTPGGVLAVQMPRNFDAPSHRLLRAVAQEGPWAPRLAPLLRVDPVAPPAAYYRWLRPYAARLDLWETEYLQVLTGEDPVLRWVRGTALVPLLSALAPEERPQFEAEYAARLRQAYPPEATGETLFPFRRLFLIANP